jgi:F-type H+-transporting ATPase subunit a
VFSSWKNWCRQFLFPVNRFGKIIFALALFAAVLTLNLRAEEPVAAAAGHEAAHAATEAAGPIVAPIAPALFHIGPLPVSNSIICTWIVALLILLIVRVSTWNIKMIPSGMQNLLEVLCEAWEELAGGVLEPKVVRWVFPFATTFFLFAVLANFVDLIPGVGSIGYGVRDTASSLPFAIHETHTPFFRPPTSDANLTFAMASIFFVMSLYWALKYNGPIGLIKHVFAVKVETNKYAFIPLFLLFIFIGIMETFSILFIRPVALALRLYGNVYGGETMLTMSLAQKSVFWSVLLSLPGYLFETAVCVLQAFVFAMLTIAFVGTLCTPSDEHGH